MPNVLADKQITGESSFNRSQASRWNRRAVLHLADDPRHARTRGFPAIDVIVLN